VSALNIFLGLAPVLLFLAGLVFVDSYKLVRFRSVVAAVLVGSAATVTAYVGNTLLMEWTGTSFEAYRQVGAPVVEEALKAAFLAWLISSDRVGFTVDAAIYGFAVGTGFAFAENLFYLGTASQLSTAAWLVRGFGTAIMHGGTTTVFALLAKTGYDLEPKCPVRPFLWAFVASVAIHAAYNQFFLPPLINMAILLVVFTLMIGVLVVVSERRTRDWLGSGFDTDQELLALLMSGRISETRVGSYLLKLRNRFDGPIVADMLCLIRIRVELSLRAKGLLMMREAGFRTAAGPDIQAKFEELRYLERTIGRTGMLAIEPIHRWSRRDLWQLSLLGSTRER
jgi:RsiW-degrading membrane proteinase PrsW (M82 family)